MQRAAAALMVFSGELLAHPGHGAAEGHFHGFGVEHALLMVAVLAFLAYAVGKR